MDQIEEYGPPPNPAKVTDSRFEAYERIYGDESWELDALSPATLAALVEEHVSDLLDGEPWDAAIEEENAGRATLTSVSARWSDVEEFVAGSDS